MPQRVAVLVVRAPDLESGDPEFGHPEFMSSSDHLLELLQFVPGSTPLMPLFFIYLFRHFTYLFISFKYDRFFFVSLCKDDANEDGTESESEVDDESLMATLLSTNASEEAGSCVESRNKNFLCSKL